MIIFKANNGASLGSYDDGKKEVTQIVISVEWSDGYNTYLGVSVDGQKISSDVRA